MRVWLVFANDKKITLLVWHEDMPEIIRIMTGAGYVLTKATIQEEQ